MTDRNSDDAVIERMERGVDPESDAEAAKRAPYRRLIERIGELDVIEPPPGWVERAVDRWERARTAKPERPRRRWAAVGGAAAVAAVLAVVLIGRCGDHAGTPDRLTISKIDRTDTRGDDWAIGDAMRIHAPRPRTGVVELRLYRDGRLITRCPGDAACELGARAIDVTVPLGRAGSYQAFAITSAQPLPAPMSDRIDTIQLEVNQADATLAELPAIDVR